MKILYILSGTGTKGGATKSFLSMADAVAKNGNEIAVVVPNEEGVTSLLRERGWKVLVVPYGYCSLPALGFNLRDIVRFIPRLIKGGICNFMARKKVLAFAKEFRPDIIHDNTSVTDIGHHVAHDLGIPHVIHVREYGWKDFHLVLPWINERLTAPNAYVVAITSELAIFRGKGIVADHLRIIYNGVIHESQIMYNPIKKHFFLYAGRIEHAKGVDELIDAYIAYSIKEKEIGNEPFRLKLAGGCDDNNFMKGLQRRLHATGLDKYVDFLGVVEDMETLYREATATIIPSYREGFGRVMPEAMAAGSLCIARRSGGLKEQLENGVKISGEKIAFGFNNVEELTNLLTEIGLECMAGNPFKEGGDYEKMIKRSQKVVCELYSCESNGKQVLDYYNKICNV